MELQMKDENPILHHIWECMRIGLIDLGKFNIVQVAYKKSCLEKGLKAAYIESKYKVVETINGWTIYELIES